MRHMATKAIQSDERASGAGQSAVMSLTDPPQEPSADPALNGSVARQRTQAPDVEGFEDLIAPVKKRKKNNWLSLFSMPRGKRSENARRAGWRSGRQGPRGATLVPGTEGSPVFPEDPEADPSDDSFSNIVTPFPAQPQSRDRTARPKEVFSSLTDSEPDRVGNLIAFQPAIASEEESPPPSRTPEGGSPAPLAPAAPPSSSGSEAKLAGSREPRIDHVATLADSPFEIVGKEEPDREQAPGDPPTETKLPPGVSAASHIGGRKRIYRRISDILASGGSSAPGRKAPDPNSSGKVPEPAAEVPSGSALPANESDGEDGTPDAPDPAAEHLRQIRSQLRAELAAAEIRVREEERSRIQRVIQSEILTRGEMIAKAEERIRSEVLAEADVRIQAEREKTLQAVAEAKKEARKIALEKAWELIRAEERSSKESIAKAIARVQAEITEETQRMLQADSVTRDEAVERARAKARAEALAEAERQLEAAKEAARQAVVDAAERARQEVIAEKRKALLELENAKEIAIAEATSRAKEEALLEAVEKIQALKAGKAEAIRQAEDRARAKVQEEVDRILQSDPQSIEAAVAEAAQAARKRAIEEAQQTVLTEERIRVHAIMAAEEQIRNQVFGEAHSAFEEAVESRAKSIIEARCQPGRSEGAESGLPPRQDSRPARGSGQDDQQLQEAPQRSAGSIPLPPHGSPRADQTDHEARADRNGPPWSRWLGKRRA